tara:strand:+ start:321 stop:521 length:201 start_codon:yes stop_codon:yes gene_type:complete
MKNGDTVEVLTGKNKGAQGILARGFTKNEYSGGFTTRVKKCVVKMADTGKERTYNRYNIKALEAKA